MPANFITQDRALIFRITHVDNVQWTLRNGLHCRSSASVDPNYVNIGNLDLIEKRRTRKVPIAPYGTLSDYVPFYFTPYSPMLYNIKTGYNTLPKRPMDEIVILCASLRTLAERDIPYVYTDRHAYLQMAGFFSSLDDLSHVDWAILRARDFARNPDDLGKMDRYQAEALVHRHLPCNALSGIVCWSEARRQQVADYVAAAGLGVPVTAKPALYF